MKKLLLLCAVLVTALSFTACNGALNGTDGKIYGQYTGDAGTLYYSDMTLWGFPSGADEGEYYTISAGTYTVDYQIYAGGYYYPGNLNGTGSFSRAYYWHSTYTVTANTGKFLSDGADKYFTLYLSKQNGLRITGDATLASNGATYSMSSGAQPEIATPGTSSWTSTDGTITVTTTNKIIEYTGETKETHLK